MTDRMNWKYGGTWLKEQRLAAEITEWELAEQIGAPSVAYVAEIESGRRAGPATMLAAYARTFGLPAAAFAARCLKFYGTDGTWIDAAA